jgi:hypothetical protein
MTTPDGGGDDRPAITRRRTLAVAAAVAGGLAGCSDIQDQSFEADPVVLPGPDQTELVLPETGRSSDTTTRTVGDGSVEASITSHLAVYRRAPGMEGA